MLRTSEAKNDPELNRGPRWQQRKTSPQAQAAKRGSTKGAGRRIGTRTSGSSSTT
jgi:hypothetical protein